MGDCKDGQEDAEATKKKNRPKSTLAVDLLARGPWGWILDPIDWVRENLVVPNQKYSPYYHRKYARVPTVDMCYLDDLPCIYEAEQQYKRDRLVDEKIVAITEDRAKDCKLKSRSPNTQVCNQLIQEWRDARELFVAKYGDLGPYSKVKDAFMKQKHRMAWERRYGPVGTGMNRITPEKKKKKPESFIESKSTEEPC